MSALAEFVATGKDSFHKCRNCGRSLYFGGLYWWHLHNKTTYCELRGSDTTSSDPFTDADANLLKAAPELLEALKATLVYLNPTTKPAPEELHKMVDAAIAKAEGR